MLLDRGRGWGQGRRDSYRTPRPTRGANSKHKIANRNDNTGRNVNVTIVTFFFFER